MTAPLTATLRQSNEDFEVEEIPGFEADGNGEHDLLWIQKSGANTAWVATQLARFAGVQPVAVGYSGLKDRHAVTRQLFSVQLPGRSVDWSRFSAEGVQVLDVRRHSRKLQRGAHRGNRFTIVLRDVAGDLEAAESLLQQAARAGVPNHFGEQRFGRSGGNTRLVDKLAGGARLDRTQRGFALSTARALIFNAVLDLRLATGSWKRLQDGDVAQLDGSGSVFGPVVVDAQLQQRCEQLDIHPTGPLWGRGASLAGDPVLQLEQLAAQEFAAARLVCEQSGLRPERRALRMRIDQLQWTFSAPERCLRLSFALERGCFATALTALLTGNLNGVDEE